MPEYVYYSVFILNFQMKRRETESNMNLTEGEKTEKKDFFLIGNISYHFGVSGNELTILPQEQQTTQKRAVQMCGTKCQIASNQASRTA